jgi:hypothetical protein
VPRLGLVAAAGHLVEQSDPPGQARSRHRRGGRLSRRVAIRLEKPTAAAHRDRMQCAVAAPIPRPYRLHPRAHRAHSCPGRVLRPEGRPGLPGVLGSRVSARPRSLERGPYQVSRNLEDDVHVQRRRNTSPRVANRTGQLTYRFSPSAVRRRCSAYHRSDGKNGYGLVHQGARGMSCM